ncbi:hypothetical protein H4R33_006859 [Dimargaris cristalligena]|uniref:Chromatin modification-related protein EAF7-domain-containing protein n=1 Tax=Dimargaris cristalligena TaxID=215637 RepID=A0A4P9ZWL7_9FUNG|nr:hypothetical protein H4R33_006859 [Dimargaris cristalligena]RKP37080.1 chromatin modification-related protein EAF7-domain-containing protein [Dimargaris cristalligena]|eukprot:RKP37080.1 chromatin modification-related protein EAF7-domain-containing protein [Dimargaris cristalligena]
MDDDSKSLDSAVTDSVQWTPQMEVALFNAMVGRKPVGIHKHFRMVAIYHHFLNSGIQPCTTQDIWEKLDELFDLQVLDDMEFNSDEDDEDTKSRKHPSEPSSPTIRSRVSIHHPQFWKHSFDFELPWDEYEAIIAEHGRDPDDHASIKEPATPTPVPLTSASSARSLRTRKGSPTPSTESVRTVSQEAHAPKKTRRTVSSTRKEMVALLADPKMGPTSSSRRKTSRTNLPSPTSSKAPPAIGTRRTTRKN